MFQIPYNFSEIPILQEMFWNLEKLFMGNQIPWDHIFLSKDFKLLNSQDIVLFIFQQIGNIKDLIQVPVGKYHQHRSLKLQDMRSSPSWLNFRPPWKSRSPKAMTSG